jgi:hypothetical protein
MCTISIVPTALGFSLMCNRDERRARPAATSPERRDVDGIGAIYPVDPVSGGTWLAVNDAGVAIALLNRTMVGVDTSRSRGRGVRPTDRLRSRGAIVPRLAGAHDSSSVLERLRGLDFRAHAPFRIVAACRDRIVVATSDGRALAMTTLPVTGPVVFTSSSLGDERAEYLRLPLFECLVRRSADPLTEQRRFHDHRWTDCPSLSVRMRRADAYTVSRSAVTVDASGVRFEYEPLPPV